MILPRYEDAFAALTQPELDVLLPLIPMPLMQGDHPTTGHDVLLHCRTHHISHADLIMRLRHDTTPTAVVCVERLIMRPIDRRTPYEVNISRLPRPPGSHRSTPAAARPGQTPDTYIIRRLAEANPKRPGSDSHTRFEYYTDGMSVGDYLKKGGRRPDLAWDSEKGFIRLEEPTEQQLQAQTGGDA